MKISIITVTYNCVDTIERTIGSVISQDYKEKEYIIIDGGSTDGTVDIIKKYDRQIDCWISESDKGIFDAMNKGIHKCSGEYIAFINGDDWYVDNNVITRMSDLLRVWKCDVLCGAARLIYADEVIAIRRPGKDDKKIWCENQYVHQSMLCRKELFEKHGLFSTKYKLGGDYEWNLRLYCAGIKYQTTDEVFSNYSLTGLSGTHSVELSKEFKSISFSYINHLKDEYSVQELKNYHNWKIDFYSKLNILEEKSLHRDMRLRCALETDGCYIWGTGKMGMFCFRLLKNMSIKIIGFIDNNIISDSIMGYPVYHPSQVDYSKRIIISVLNDPEGVVEQIKESEKDYILLKEFVDNFRA